jgi:hypothetical protein
MVPPEFPRISDRPESADTACVVGEGKRQNLAYSLKLQALSSKSQI